MKTRRWFAALTAAVALLGVAPLAGATTNETAKNQPYLVTFVARQCPAYSDITANLARNNIMESLQDLGPDTPYVGGQPIDPTIESTHQPACTPLQGFQFSLGSGLGGRVDGLTTVTNATAPITVQRTTPLLDAQGQPTGQSIAAAATIELTSQQESAAMNGYSLWAQGGTPLNPLPSADHIAFGAFRCAVDNLNGDNVEWIGYPTGAHHVFCYYYAVATPSAPGEIIVKKVLPAGQSATSAFRFEGSVSYNPGGQFDVKAGEQVSFLRASGVTWDLSELPTAGFGFVRASCESANGTSVVSTTGTMSTIDLGSGDVVTCTYENQRTSTELSLLKQTVNGTGGPFSFTVTPPAGASTTLSATTTEGLTPVLAGVIRDVTVGTYTVTEDVPAPTADGRWVVDAFDCNGKPQTPSASEVVHVTSVDQPIACTFTNRWIPRGTITIEKISTNAVGTFDFAVRSTDASSEVPVTLRATTTNENVATPAVEVSGAPLNPLAAGTYSVDETSAAAPAGYTWELKGVDCGAADVTETSAGVLVHVTAADPHVVCTFTDTLSADSPTLPPITEPELPFTGGPAPILWWASGALTLLGVGLVLASRRRRA